MIYGREGQAPNDKEYSELLAAIMNLGHPYKNIVPSAFATENNYWGYASFSFDYVNKQMQPVVISITYTPRWHATVDGTPIHIYNHENLMMLKLPGGKHRVIFHYGMTWIEWLGIVLSVLSLTVIILFMLGIYRIKTFFNTIGNYMNDILASIID
mgnify:CR=1 FL=1